VELQILTPTGEGVTGFAVEMLEIDSSFTMAMIERADDEAIIVSGTALAAPA
jgi:hypothetical protein